MARKLTDTVQLKLRFPEALRRRLEREARRHGQSLNGEIVSILEGRFRESDDADLHAAAFAEALRDEFMRLYREDKARRQTAEPKTTPVNEPRSASLGKPIKRWQVFPLNNPIQETPEPNVPLPERAPEKKPKPVPLREKEPQFSVWTATPLPKTEDDGEKK
jgi:Arc-like DNA binding dprotein